MDMRVAQHRADDHFIEYCKRNKIKYDDLIVEYVILANATEEDVVEKVLINKLKPELNTKDNHDTISGIISISLDGMWHTYAKQERQESTYRRNRQIIKKTRNWYICDHDDEIGFCNLFDRWQNLSAGIKVLDCIPGDKNIYDSEYPLSDLFSWKRLDGTKSIFTFQYRLTDGKYMLSRQWAERVSEKRQCILLNSNLKRIKMDLPLLKYSANKYREIILDVYGYSKSFTGRRTLPDFVFEMENDIPVYETDITYYDAREWIANELKKYKLRPKKADTFYELKEFT